MFGIAIAMSCVQVHVPHRHARPYRRRHAAPPRRAASASSCGATASRGLSPLRANEVIRREIHAPHPRATPPTAAP